MSTAAAWSGQLAALRPELWPSFVTTHSGLPGPRANLALVDAVARSATDEAVAALLADGGEYAVMCAAAALGRRADDPELADRARVLAADERWRVREGVALGLQLCGDESPSTLLTIVTAWVDDADPLVQRAAVAAVCEPRLLRTAEAAATAISVCQRATTRLVALAPARRSQSYARTLRQALGYAWSVAIAADPTPGLAAFRTLDIDDPDIAWIVRENRRKKRLAALE